MSEAAAVRKWYSIAVTVDKTAAEAVEFALNSLDALGTEIGDMPKDRGETVTVIGYFDKPPDEPALSDEIAHAFQIYGLPEETAFSIALGEVEDRDWLAEWKEYWTPQTVGRFIIAPPWAEVKSDDKIVIRIEPNMAFGTGTHETTQLCLRAIEDNYQPGMSFLDVGTGTGILAIAAAKLATEDTEGTEKGENDLLNSSVASVSSVVKLLAYDTDPEAIKIARENAVNNSVSSLIEFVEGPLPESGPEFDMVCANLTLGDILPILSLLISKTRKTLILSGILAEQEGEIVSALRERSVSSVKIERAGEWLAMAAETSRSHRR